MSKKFWLGSIIVFAVLCFAGLAQAAGQKHLRLIDRLDRPQDGYCVDVPGVGRNMRVELPLFAHNCKPRLTGDSAVVFTPKGRIRFAALDLCITAAGVNSAALAGAALLLRPCGGSAPFFDTAGLQRFTLAANGQLSLRGSTLCIMAGAESARTLSAGDRWRTLFLAKCGTAPKARSRWEFVTPGK